MGCFSCPKDDRPCHPMNDLYNRLNAEDKALREAYDHLYEVAGSPPGLDYVTLWQTKLRAIHMGEVTP